MNGATSGNERASDTKWWGKVVGWLRKLVQFEDHIFPRQLRWQKRVVLLIVYVLSIGAFVVALDQISFEQPLILSSYPLWAYTGFSLGLAGLFLDRYLRHKVIVHRSRLEDPSEIQASIQEAKTVEPRLSIPTMKPDNYPEKTNELDSEVERLDEIGPEAWTEYQVLPLKHLLVDFLKLDDLRALAHLILTELGQYAQDSAYHYDTKTFTTWENRVDRALEKIAEFERLPDSDEKVPRLDESAEALRAEVTILLDHLAGYQLYWKEGYALVNSLRICSAVAIPVLLAMGFLPFVHPSGDVEFGVLSWALFGAVGALTGVLLSLRKSDVIEVGNTEGRKELSRAVSGSTLGLVAGVVTYSLMTGGLVQGPAIPNPNDLEMGNVILTLLWAVGGGFSFERIFERMRVMTETAV